MKYIKYTKEMLEEAVKKSLSFAGVLRELGLKQAGGTQCHLKRVVIKYGIDYSHFTGSCHNRGKASPKRIPWEEVLVISRVDRREHSFRLRRALIESGVEEKCSECGVKDCYNNKPIVLQVDHIDGDWINNLKENLRFLCPNCHSQTSNFGRKKQ
jgi:hypothetical protein